MISQKSKTIEKSLTDPSFKRSYNRQMFDIIASSYSLITGLLSWGRDRGWKKKLVSSLEISSQTVVLDIACGTGDIAFEISRRNRSCKIIGIDLTPKMLAVASKVKSGTNVSFSIQDMDAIALKDQSVNIITGGYMLRNAPQLSKALGECRRVLKPGGTAAFLDFSKPHQKILQAIELFMLWIWCGTWGWLFHRNPRVYTYIPESLKLFPDRVNLRKLMKDEGFSVISSRLFFFGVVEMLVLKKLPSE
jgi:demethylmenaquinone methyltransferase/2-methoxy-6-polyprenyl-1,4-benzoquinol methylase